jgi:hypothetical protein
MKRLIIVLIAVLLLLLLVPVACGKQAPAPRPAHLAENAIRESNVYKI